MSGEFLPPPNLGLTLGTLELGVLIATVLYGTVIVQMFGYFHSQFRDRTGIRCLPRLEISLVETIETSFLWVYLYSRTVEHFGNADILDQSHWSLAFSVPVGNIVVFCVQLYFAYKVYRLSGKWYYVVFCIPASTLRLAMGFAIAVTMTSQSLLISEYVNKYKWIVIVHLSAAAVIDVANTAALYICFKKRSPSLYVR
ncbi:hypothetical protein K435DRAFT_649204 [Dendrothele bispora CBS 962.96]|uniref:Uncharacterized protein n=1 Tax=Dendrothele bispora (strain CBS 962.96) TaxID=1314807 RepID=A0A4S8MP07_DENBC|nr:hypothetical protein K435DRAFT_649204 [Dendrothele bispora CBS 962.96]